MKKLIKIEKMTEVDFKKRLSIAGPKNVKALSFETFPSGTVKNETMVRGELQVTPKALKIFSEL